jgi:DHA1 family tetracycline resistance protein-like MFS transporter
MVSTRTKRILPVLFGTLLLDTIGFGMVFPIIPILFTDPTSPSFLLTGYSHASQLFFAGLITAVFGLTQFIASPILGELSDVFGRKKLLTLGVAVLAFSQLMFGFGIEIHSLILLFVARTIAGFAAGNFSIAQATIADVTEPKDRAKNFGLIGAAYGIGFVVGPVLSGWLAGLTHNAAVPFWFAGLLGLLNVLFVTFFLTETRKKEAGTKYQFTWLKGIRNIRTAISDRDVRPLYLSSFLYFAGFSFFTSFIGVLLVTRYGFSATSIGTFFGVVGVCIFVTQMFILRAVAGKFSERSIIKYAIPITAVVVAVYPFMPAAEWIYLLIPIMAVPQGLTMAMLPALISKKASNERQGAALGINGSLMALASGVIPLVAGVSTGIIGLGASFIGGALLMVGSWAVLFVFTRKA